MSETLAPLFASSWANKYPCIPEDLLLINLTGSIGSKVGPAVIKVSIPLNSKGFENSCNI